MDFKYSILDETTINHLCTPPVNSSIQRQLFFKNRESYLRSQNIFYEILDELFYEFIEEIDSFQGDNESGISLLSSSVVTQNSYVSSKSKSESYTTETTIIHLCTPPVNCSIQREQFFKKRESYLRSQNVFYEILDELLYEFTFEEINSFQDNLLHTIKEESRQRDKEACEEESLRIGLEISRIRVPLLLARGMTVNDLKHKFIGREFLVKITVPANLGLPKITILRPMLYYGRTGNWFYRTKPGQSAKTYFDVFYADGMHQVLSSETIRRSIVTISSVPIDDVNSCRFHYWNLYLCDRIAEEILRKAKMRQEHSIGLIDI